MKYAFLTIGLLLAACAPKVAQQPVTQPESSASSSSADYIQAGETMFVEDDAKTIAIHTTLYQCLDHVARGCTKCYGEADETPKLMKAQAAVCDENYWDEIRVEDDPSMFYTMTRQGKGPDPFQEFVLCAHELTSWMWDIPAGYTSDQFRRDIRDCLDKFPN